jgi:hypothetical protein
MLTAPARPTRIGDMVEMASGEIGVIRSWAGKKLELCTVSVGGVPHREIPVNSLILIEEVGKWNPKK